MKYAGEALELIEAAERFFAATGATFRHGGSMAYYAPGPDLIQLHDIPRVAEEQSLGVSNVQFRSSLDLIEPIQLSNRESLGQLLSSVL